MKYEIFRVNKQGLTFEIGLMHHDALTHADVVEHMKVCVSSTYETTFDEVEVVGAGFCTEGFPIKCWGHSESLNISSRGDADELVLISSMLNFQNVKVSPFDRLCSGLANVSQTSSIDHRKMREKIYVVGRELEVCDIREDGMAYFEQGMLLRYVGPTLDADGDPAYMFRVDSTSKYSADYGSVYLLTDNNMGHIFEDSEIVRRLARMQSGVVLLDDKPHVVSIHGIMDPWPLTDNHDEFRAVYSLLGDDQVLTKDGSLKQILDFFHIEMD